MCEFLGFTVNNIGDPFGETNYKTNSFAFEREIVEYFASLFNLQDNHPYWGYVTSGGSEGNLVGIDRGLKRYPDATVYFTRATHYSVEKACKLTRANYQYLPMDDSDSIVPKAAIQAIDPNKPAILVLNVGTTMTGAIDNLAYMSDMLFKRGIPGYIHCDAALTGSLLPFISHKPSSSIDFGLYNIDSVSISGHKFWQVPTPCGIFLQKGEAERKLDKGAVLSNAHPQENFVEYVGCKDSTLLGSRSGLAVLLFWHRIMNYQEIGLEKIAEDCTDKAAYLIENIPNSWRTGLWSNIVVFPIPPKNIIEQYQLATQADIAHCVMMPNTKWETLDNFIYDYNKVMDGEI